jgi:hypothetical protein
MLFLFPLMTLMADAGRVIEIRLRMMAPSIWQADGTGIGDYSPDNRFSSEAAA